MTTRHAATSLSADVSPAGINGIQVISPTGDGVEIDANRFYVMAGNAIGDPGDATYLLPQGPTIKPGTVYTVFFVPEAGETMTIQLQGSDVFVDMSTSYAVSDGNQTTQDFMYIGNTFLLAPGTPLWVRNNSNMSLFSTSGFNPEQAGLFLRADWMTETPLPSFTPTGGGEEGTILTADANGQLSIKGNLINASNTICIASEQGANRRWHGLWRVTQAGDGSNPWILTIEKAWAQGNIWNGAAILVDGPGTDAAQRGTLISFSGKADSMAGGGTEKDAIRTLRQHHVMLCEYIQTAELPAYTVTGTGHAKRLTANANGEFDLDGLGATSLGQWSKIGVVNQATVGDNGVYVLEDTGSVGTPWVLRVAWDWAGLDQVRGFGALILSLANNPTNGLVEGAAFYKNRDQGSEQTKTLNLALIPDIAGGGARVETARPWIDTEILPGATNQITTPTTPYHGMRFGVHCSPLLASESPGLSRIIGVPDSYLFNAGVMAGGWTSIWEYRGSAWKLVELTGIERDVLAHHPRRDIQIVGAMTITMLTYTTAAAQNGKLFEVEINTTGIDSSGADALHVHRKILVRRNAAGTLSVDNNTALVNYVAAGLAGSDADVNVSGNDINVRVTNGAGGATVDFRSKITIRGVN